MQFSAFSEQVKHFFLQGKQGIIVNKEELED
jgi:hypothetical protein